MQKLSKAIINSGFSAVSIHGNKSQGQRERVLKSFRSGENKVLVATDIAACGLDIPLVKHVYNFNLPNVPENYVHRIGRTARAGADGSAITFCSSEEVTELKAIQKMLGVEIPIASGKPWQGLDAEPRKNKSRHRPKNSWGKRKATSATKNKLTSSAPKQSRRNKSHKRRLAA